MARYVLITAADGYVAPDGSTVPAGTAFNRIIADPGFTPPAGLSMVPDTGQVLWQPPKSATISRAAFWGRFDPLQQLNVLTLAQKNAQASVWITTALAADSIELSAPETQAGMAFLVGAGVLDAEQAAQILTP